MCYKEYPMKQKIVIVSHCFLNDAAKLRNQDAADMEQERTKKRSFLKELLEQGIEVLQLPCPEFILYGCNRWGHAASQFDTPHFRQEARNMLLPIVMQLEEYAAYPDRYDILGVYGINGSPSCGVDYTYDGDWGGELGGKDAPCQLDKAYRPGIFMDVFAKLLEERHLSIKFYTLDAENRPR